MGWLRTLLLAGLGLLLMGCPQGPQAAPLDAFDIIKARGAFVVAMDVGYDPFEIKQPDGEVVGFDVDLIKAIAADLGVEMQLKPVDWDGVIGELRTGKVDAIISGMSITEERAKAVSFSEPYFQVGQVVLKRKGDERIKSYMDLNDPSLTVATQLGTTGEQAVRKMMPQAKIKSFPKADEGCLDVIQGQSDAIVFDHPFLQKYLAKHSDALEGLLEPFTKEPIGAALRKDSPKLVAAINATFARLRESGEMKTLVAKWFEASATPAPPATQPNSAGQ